MSLIPDGYPASSLEAFAVLESHDTLSIDDLKVLAMIEQSGQRFYEALARVAPDAAASALLERNAREELGHAHRMLKAIRLLGGNFSLPAADENPYALPMAFDRLDIGLLNLMMKGEVDGGETYRRWAGNEPNPDVAKLYRLSGDEEARHGRRVEEVIALLQ